MGLEIRAAAIGDLDGLLALHKTVSVDPAGLARSPDEITPAYVESAIGADICLLALTTDGVVVGAIHARRESPALFEHVLGGLTVAVHPDGQGRGVGSALFQALIARARALDPPILRIELATGASNLGAVRLYERLGFQHEGRQIARGRYPDGQFDDDILMGLLL